MLRLLPSHRPQLSVDHGYQNACSLGNIEVLIHEEQLLPNRGDRSMVVIRQLRDCPGLFFFFFFSFLFLSFFLLFLFTSEATAKMPEFQPAFRRRMFWKGDVPVANDKF